MGRAKSSAPGSSQSPDIKASRSGRRASELADQLGDSLLAGAGDGLI